MTYSAGRAGGLHHIRPRKDVTAPLAVTSVRVRREAPAAGSCLLRSDDDDVVSQGARSVVRRQSDLRIGNLHGSTLTLYLGHGTGDLLEELGPARVAERHHPAIGDDRPPAA